MDKCATSENSPDQNELNQIESSLSQFSLKNEVHLPRTQSLSDKQDDIEMLASFPRDCNLWSFADVQSEFDTKFKQVKILGQGTYGAVFEAINELDKWKYAVKRIPVRGSDVNLKKALKEVQAMALFDHPGIVRYNHAWIEGAEMGSNIRRGKGGSALLYIQMELCQSTLDEWLSKHQHRDLSRMKSWFKQIVSAVAYIHEKEKIHRDLKPSNILFSDEDTLKVCDLGIITDCATVTEEGVVEEDERTYGQGTKMYMAPEQRYFEYSHKVDIFALGLILAELCVPMTKDEAMEVFENYRNGRPNNVVEALSELGEFVAGMTNVNDSDRPECNELLKHPFLENTETQFNATDGNANREVEFVAAPVRRKLKFIPGTGGTPMSMPENMEDDESEFLKKFEPLRILGAGGFGSVYEARNLLDRCTYAVKKMLIDQRFMEEDLSEVRAQASLRHEGFVSYKSSWVEQIPVWQLDAFRDNCVFLYIQMELCLYSLDHWIKVNDTRDLAQAKRWFKDLVLAVQFLHDNNRVHRDLKPANIMIGKDLRIKICDMGLTAHKVIENGRKVQIDIEYTGQQNYMAPEQLFFMFSCEDSVTTPEGIKASKSVITSKVDICSLGLIFADLSVVFTDSEREAAFDGFRFGIPNFLKIDILKRQPELVQFICWITNPNVGGIVYAERPTCAEILRHAFLASTLPI